MIDKVELRRRDGASLGLLTPHRVTIDVAGDRDITRTLMLALAATDLPRVKPLGLRSACYDGVEPLFIGSLDGPRAANRDQVTVDITGRDNNKDLAEACWAADVLVEDAAVVDDLRSISAVTASSEVTTNAAIQQYASLYGWSYLGGAAGSWVEETVIQPQSQPFIAPSGATNIWPEEIGGGMLRWRYTIWRSGSSTPVTGVIESGSPITGDYSVAPAASGGLETFSVQFIADTKESDVKQSVACTTNGTAVLATSTDGITWAAYAAGATWRYLRVTITKSSPSISITCGLVILGSGNAAINVKTDTGKSWRSAAGDYARIITLDLGASVASNVAYLKPGTADTDKLTRYKLRLEGSNDQSAWTLLADNVQVGCARRCEVLYTQGSYRYIRITVLWASGPVALRYVEIRNTVTTQPVHAVVQSLLAAQGETQFDLMPTRIPVRRFIGEQGKPIIPDVKALADTAGMEVFRRRDGRICMRPRDNYDVTQSIGTFTAALELSAEWRDDVVNEIIGRADSVTFRGSYIAGDYSASSPTGVPTIGRRTRTVTFPLADTQAKLEAATRAELARVLKRTVTARAIVAGIPTLEYGDIVRLVDADLGINGYFVVDAFTLNDDAEASTYDTDMQLREVSA